MLDRGGGLWLQGLFSLRLESRSLYVAAVPGAAQGVHMGWQGSGVCACGAPDVLLCWGCQDVVSLHDWQLRVAGMLVG